MFLGLTGSIEFIENADLRRHDMPLETYNTSPDTGIQISSRDHLTRIELKPIKYPSTPFYLGFSDASTGKPSYGHT